MDSLLAILAGGLFAVGVYLVLRRTLAQLIIGLALLSNAANLVILAAAGPGRDAPALVPSGMESLPGDAADPVPQALILTAIVISFAVIAFFIVLVDRVHQATGTDDVALLTTTDRLEYEAPPEVSPERRGLAAAPRSLPDESSRGAPR